MIVIADAFLLGITTLLAAILSESRASWRLSPRQVACAENDGASSATQTRASKPLFMEMAFCFYKHNK
ncbi:hypothetical protein A593_06585 [Klebsiella variicola]|nr:hypothetical protein A593_06585 [Klebsiella variicola]